MGKHPQAEAYFELAYRAVVEGDNDLAGQYMSLTEEAIDKGVTLKIMDGKKPIDEGYDRRKRAKLGAVT